MSTHETALVDQAIQLNGSSLQALRATQRRWFIGSVVAITMYALTIGFALRGGIGALVGFAALPLFLVVFHTARLAGVVQAVERMRSVYRN